MYKIGLRLGMLVNTAPDSPVSQNNLFLDTQAIPVTLLPLQSVEPHCYLQQEVSHFLQILFTTMTKACQQSQGNNHKDFYFSWLHLVTSLSDDHLKWRSSVIGSYAQWQA